MRKIPQWHPSAAGIFCDSIIFHVILKTPSFVAMSSATSQQQPPNKVLSQSLWELNALLSDTTEHGRGAQPSSKLSQHLLMAIHRHRASMDWIIGKLSRGRVRPRSRRVLYWAMAEILWSDGVPAPIVVDVATAQVKKRYAAAEAGFVNAFLRQLCSQLDAKGRDGLTADAPPWVKLELPELLWKRWQQLDIPQGLPALAAVLQEPAETVLRRRRWPERPLPTKSAKFLRHLASPPWAPEQELFALQAIADDILSTVMGAGTPFYIQDPSTLLAPALLAVKPGEEVADLCCAPGGKSLLLAEALRGQGHLHCFDRAAAKLPRVRTNLAGFKNVSIAVADASAPQLAAASLDAVMLDVPCSNTGVIRRRPDVRWAFSEASLRELCALQAQILQAAAPLLKPGGRLVYSTCSIEKEENCAQIQAFLAQHPDFILLKEEQLWPTNSHDGAYAALLRRKDP
jgi:16S rRNA (cytosine967-C5)-methyltransferase